MAEVIRMPRLSDTMEEGTIVSWNKKVGDEVESGEVLAEVETDKATMELESYYDGTLLYIGIKEGESVPIDAILAVVGEKGEDYKKLLEKEQKTDTKSNKEESENEPKEEQAIPVAKEVQTGAEKESRTFGRENGRIKASPLAKRLAQEKGIDIADIEGSGDGGRIIKRDIEEFKGAPQKVLKPSFAGTGEYEDKPVSQMRKTIAKRLTQSKFTAPHFYLTIEIDMNRAVGAREKINELLEDNKISFNDIIIKAVAATLKEHPQVNASWMDDKIRYYKNINIGVAVAVEEGLVVPVIRFVDSKGLSEIGREVKEFAKKAKDKKLQPTDWEGNTFTISNLGMFGIEEFTAIINPPDSCIMAVGNIRSVPAFENGEIVEKKVMKVTLSCDHRVVDGATGARFLKSFKEKMEEPIRIIL